MPKVVWAVMKAKIPVMISDVESRQEDDPNLNDESDASGEYYVFLFHIKYTEMWGWNLVVHPGHWPANVDKSDGHGSNAQC